ncbi:hypothetical protein KAI58_04895 [Candidatus Gracilibacteria bacterium]|nr:hypothetical protein [Candidatus Gracilibacteria bacterium]
MKKFFIGLSLSLGVVLSVPNVQASLFLSDISKLLEVSIFRPLEEFFGYEEETEETKVEEKKIEEENSDLTIKNASVVFVSPEDGTTNVSGKMPVTFLFADSIFALQNPETVQNFLKETIKVDPVHAGSWQLLGTSGILFEPEESWVNSTYYEIFIPSEITGADILHTFETPRITLKNVQSYDLIGRKPIVLTFSQKVDLSEVRKISFSPNIEFDVEYKIEEDGSFSQNIVRLTPREDWSEDTSFSLTVPAGFSSLEGPLKTKMPVVRKFSTIQSFKIRNSEKPEHVFNSFTLSFTTPVYPKDLIKNLEILPKPEIEVWEKYLKELEKSENERNYYRLPPFGKYWDPHTKYTVKLSENLMDKYGRVLGDSFSKSFTVSFPTTFNKVFLPENNSVLKPETKFKPTFWYSGDISEVQVEVNEVLLQKQKFSKTFSVEKSPDKEQFWEFDLQEHFPDIFTESGEWLPGKYEISVEGKKEASVLDTINEWTGRRWWPQSYETSFYVSEFGVALKDLPKNEYEIQILAFPGEEALPESFSYEIFQRKNYKEVFYKEPIKTDFNVKNSSYIEFSGRMEVLVVKAGEKVGFGGSGFGNGFDIYESKISLNPNFYERDQIRKLSFSDRPLYKPGQKVYFKSLFRELETRGKTFPLKNVNFLLEEDFVVKIRDSRWNEVEILDVSGTKNSFDGYWDIPEDAPHGNYQLQFSTKSGKSLGELTLFIGEYRKSNFLLDAEFNKEAAFYKEDIVAKTKAEFAFGGALKNRSVSYRVFLEGYKDCGWRFWGDWGCCGSEEKTLEEGKGILDEKGIFEKPANFNFEIEKDDPVWSQLKLRVTVKESDAEENSKEISVPFYMSAEKLILDRSPYYFKKGTQVEISGKITDWQEESLGLKEIAVQLFRSKDLLPIPFLEKDADGNEIVIEVKPIWESKIYSEKNGEFQISFEAPEEAGNYELKFISVDEKERITNVSKTFWVPGVENRTLRTEDENKMVPLLLDKEVYEIGETVEVFIPHSDWEIVRARATLERGEILEELPIDLETQTVSFLVEAWMVPNVYVSVVLEGKDENNNPKVKWGIVNISVSDSIRALDIELTPNKTVYNPGETALFKIKTSAGGNPIPAELTVVVVDETLLAIKSRDSMDLIKTFLADLPLGISFSHTLANFVSQMQIDEVLKNISEIKLFEDEQDFDEMDIEEYSLGAVFSDSVGGRGIMNKSMMLMESVSAPQSAGVDKVSTVSTPRENFQDTAKFVGKLLTDENGEGELIFDLPDNLTTWNIFVVGHTESNNFGSEEFSVQTQLPLLISEIVPNFFQMGDTLRVGLLIRRDMPEIEKEQVRVSLIADIDKVEVLGEREKTVEIEEEGRVFFDLKIPTENFDLKKEFETMKFGFSVKGLTSGLTDSIILERKLFPPKVALTAAEFLRVDGTKSIDIKPDFVRAITSKLLVKVFLSLAERLGTLIDVTSTRDYGCAEQRFSHSTAVLVQKEFDDRLGRKSGEISISNLKETRDYIEKSFVYGGGFSFWKGEREASVWVTTQILEFANLWEKHGVEINEKKLSDSRTWLKREILKSCDDWWHNWRCISGTTRQNAGYVLARDGKISSKDLNTLSNYTRSLEAKVWWLKTARVLQEKNIPLLESDKRHIVDFWKEIDSHLKARDRYIYWEENKTYWSFYTQNERLTALIFEEALKQNRLPDYQHKIARYLSETKIENFSGNSALRVLQSLGQYAEMREAKNLGASFVIQTRPLGSDVMSEKGVLENLDSEYDFEKDITKETSFKGLLLKPENKKPFYADIVLQETFPAKDLTSVERGFWLERNIYALEDEEMETPLTQLELGKNYIVKLNIVTNTSHRQIMLEDKIPSGAEFVNFEFENVNKELQKLVGNNSQNNYRCWGWCVPTFNHKEFHAEKARFFAHYLSPGAYEVKYIIKTRLPGVFEVLPARVEEMYYPEVFALTKGEKVTIVEP